MSKNITDEDLDLLGQLGVDTAPEKKQALTPKEQRIIAGFEEIVQFVQKNDRLPRHEEGSDIFERLYAVRLERIKSSTECREVLSGYDKQGLLDEGGPEKSVDDLDDDELLRSLGAEETVENDILKLTHVQSKNASKSTPDDIGQRTTCADFEKYESEFAKIQSDLESGLRYSYKYKDNAEINLGDLFIIEGQKAKVVEVGDLTPNDQGRLDGRLKVVFDNGTESNLLLRSLQRALNRDKTSRRISFDQTEVAPIFSSTAKEGDLEVGCIYVVRSKSNIPYIAERRNVIHKIGVTGGSAKKRVAGAKTDPTYLMAEVEIVAEFKLYNNINRQGLESMIQSIFANARLDININDRFGKPFKPKEWFVVPLGVIEQVVEMIKLGTIENYVYDIETATMVESSK